MQVPDAAVVTASTKSSGTVHALLVPSPDPIVPVSFSKEYDSVCVKSEEARGIEMVILLPMSTSLAESVGCVARGIVLKTASPSAVCVPKYTSVRYTFRPMEQDISQVFEPSAECLTVTVLVYSVFVWFADKAAVKLKLYFVPFMVTVPLFSTLEMMV